MNLFDNIMVNLNTIVSAGSLKDYIAESPVQSVLKFAYGEFRFTIEHHAIMDWTIVVEDIKTEQPVVYEEHISTFRLGEITSIYLG